VCATGALSGGADLGTNLHVWRPQRSHIKPRWKGSRRAQRAETEEKGGGEAHLRLSSFRRFTNFVRRHGSHSCSRVVPGTRKGRETRGRGLSSVPQRRTPPHLRGYSMRLSESTRSNFMLDTRGSKGPRLYARRGRSETRFREWSNNGPEEQVELLCRETRAKQSGGASKGSYTHAYRCSPATGMVRVDGGSLFCSARQ
jgi:hypothetical protein